MADVDMADAPPSGAVSKKKTGAAGESSKALGDKKRFEVKKVGIASSLGRDTFPMGMGIKEKGYRL